MTYQTILVKANKGVGYLTLNRPNRMNSFTIQMHQEVAKVLNQWKNDNAIRAIVITGNGRGFCAGQDLKERSFDPDAPAPDLGLSLENYYNPLIQCITSLPKPVVCAVNGVAAGAGASIALACDIVIAAKSATFIQAFCHLGLVPDAGGTWLLPRLVGRARAMGLAMLGDKISADRALHLGMIWQVVADDQLLVEVTRLAEHLANQPTYGLSLIKKAINASADNSFEQQLALERDLQRLAGKTDDYKEGVQAFIQKRTPVFQGH